MANWHALSGSSEGESLLSELPDRDCAPDTCEDPTFFGIAPDAPSFCRVHKLAPRKCVAFESFDTGRRFYMCSVEDEAKNCGFVSWVDAEWPEAAKNALRRLWEMYHDSNGARIDGTLANAKLLKEVADEKNKIEKKYNYMVDEVNKFIMDTRMEAIEKEEGHDDMKRQMAITIELLLSQVRELKLVQRRQDDVMKEKEQQWDKEKRDLNDEKRKVEYQLFDVWKANNANKDKIKRMKEFLDE